MKKNIILGIIITLTSGFNVDMITREHNQVRLNLGKEFEIEIELGYKIS